MPGEATYAPTRYRVSGGYRVGAVRYTAGGAKAAKRANACLICNRQLASRYVVAPVGRRIHLNCAAKSKSFRYLILQAKLIDVLDRP